MERSLARGALAAPASGLQCPSRDHRPRYRDRHLAISFTWGGAALLWTTIALGVEPGNQQEPQMLEQAEGDTSRTEEPTADRVPAREPPDEAPATRPRTVVLLDPQASRLGSVLSSFDSILTGVQELKVNVRVESSTAQDVAGHVLRARAAVRRHGALAALWLDEDADGALTLYLYDARRDRLHSRTMRSKTESDALAREALSVVVHAVLQALLEGRHIEMQEAEWKPRPQPEMAKTVPRRSSSTERLPTPAMIPQPRRRFALGAAYRGTNVASDTNWQHGLEVHGSFHPVAWLGGLLAFSWIPDTDLQGDGVGINLNRRLIELGADARASFGQFHAGFDVRLQMEVVTRNTQTVPQGFSAVSPSTDIRFGSLVTARLAWNLHGPLHVVSHAGVEAPWSRHTYLTRSVGNSSSSASLPELAIDEARVRPVVLLGLEATFQ